MRVLVDRAAHEQVALVTVSRGAEDVVASGVLELADGTDRGAVHHPPDAREEASSPIQCVVEVDQVIGSCGSADSGATSDARTGSRDDALRLNRARAVGQSVLDVEAQTVADLIGEEAEEIDAGVFDHLAADLDQEAVLVRAEVDERVEHRIGLGEVRALSRDGSGRGVRGQARDLNRLTTGRVELSRNVEHGTDEASLEDHLVIEARRYRAAAR